MGLADDKGSTSVLALAARYQLPAPLQGHLPALMRVARGLEELLVQACALVGLAEIAANAAWRQRAEVMAQASPHNPGRPMAGAATKPSKLSPLPGRVIHWAHALKLRPRRKSVATQLSTPRPPGHFHPPKPAAQAVFLDLKKQVQFQLDRMGQGPGAVSTLWPISHHHGNGAGSRFCASIELLATVGMADHST